MAKLSHAERSEISRKAWRKRKREGGKAKCAFCGKSIFARGVRMNGKPYHKGCAEAKGAGLKPAQVGKNPGTNWHVDRGNDLLAQRTVAIKRGDKEEAVKLRAKIGENIHAAEASRKRGMNPRKSFTDAWIFVRGLINTQGRMWPRHMGRLDVTEVIEFGTIADDYGLTDKGYNDLIDKAQRYYDTHIIGLKNPRKITERKRAPRDAFRYFGAEELNPIDVHPLGGGLWLVVFPPTEVEQLLGMPSGTIYNVRAKTKEEATKKALARYKKMRKNPKFKFGPTGFRPPAKWFAKMAQGTSASHFGRKLKELTTSQRAKVGQIVGGIWAKYTDATRLDILRKYEPSAVRALANPSMLGKRAQMLNCPACGGPNPVSRLNVYLRCNTCGAPLRSVRVRHKH